MKRIVLTGVFVVVLMCIHTVSFADVTAVFGPKVYARGKGKPAVAVDAFSAAAGAGRLTVYNGDGNKKHAVSSARIDVNGIPIFTPRDFKGHTDTIEETIDLIDDNTITVALDGKPGAVLTVVITQESQASPPTVTIAATPSVIHKDGAATLSWSAEGAAFVVIDNGIGAVSTSGSCLVTPAHTTTYCITACGPHGSARARAVIVVEGTPEVLPEGSFGARYQELVPADATLDRYDSRRFSIVRGMVVADDDSPLSGVAVTIYSHPEYGTAYTDDTGFFSVPVEGGGTVVLTYYKEEFCSAQRKVFVPWNDVVAAEPIRMIARDPRSTTFTFDGNPTTAVAHQSSVVIDEFGSRACSIVFTGDNRAYMTDEAGNDILELTTITARATEYTTEDSMPSVLPPTSAYTYCVELEVDGIERVRFEKPVVTWIDNFLGFPVGAVVPVGFYNRDRGVWVPAENGVVVRLLDTDGDGIADALDADGDETADDLNGDGLVADEVQGLNDPLHYPPNETFWRAAVSHFTPVDYNWPYSMPADATAPNPEVEPLVDQEKVKEETCTTALNSFVEERSRTFHEDIHVAGTDITLHYASNRVHSYKTVITVPVSGETVPASLKRIMVQVTVAGRTFESTLDPLPYQVTQVEWDGMDFLGNPVEGAVPVRIQTGFVYDIWFAGARMDLAQAFGFAGVEPYPILGRSEVVLWKNRDAMVHRDHVATIAEGWTLSMHHKLDPVNPSFISKGNGERCENNISLINTVAGVQESGYSGDGGPAIDARFRYPRHVAADAEGNYYIVDTGNQCMRKVDSDGIITTIAGNGQAGYCGDGGLAVNAQLDYPNGIALDREGNLYIADTCNCRIRKIDTRGVITTVAGNGIWGSSGDGGPAVNAGIDYVEAITVDTEGNLYLMELGSRRLRKVDTQGIITTIAGNGEEGWGGDGGNALNAQLSSRVYGMTVDMRGNIYLSDNYNCRVRKIDTSGVISTVAGNGRRESSGDGGPAVEAGIAGPRDVVVDQIGNLYITDPSGNKIRKVDTAGNITTVAGNGSQDNNDEGVPATGTGVCVPTGITIDGAGHLIIVCYQRVRKVALPAVFNDYTESDDLVFVDNDGMAYIMSAAGLHTQTIDPDTGVMLYRFEYDDNNNLTAIYDRFGAVVALQRDGDGIPTAIVSSDGLITTLTIDEHNHLTGVTGPDGAVYTFDYTPEGLLLVETEPSGNRFDHLFDSTGRLTDALDEEGGCWNYERALLENGAVLVNVLTAEGNRTSYLDRTDSTGAYASIITDPTGSATLFNRSADGLSVKKTLSCGMNLAFTYDTDPQYKYPYITTMTERTPSGLERTTERSKSYADTDSDGIFDLITETVNVNGNAAVLEKDVIQSQKTAISPEGRTANTAYDSATLLITSSSVPGLFDTFYGYDGRERLTSLTQGTRQMTWSYNGEGFCSSWTDPQGFTTTYDYDPAGRMTALYRPDDSVLYFGYDANGNRETLVTPASVSHIFDYNRVNNLSLYQAPVSGAYRYLYDKDRRLICTTFPSGNRIEHIYDGARLTQVLTPEGSIHYTYLCGTKVASVTSGTEAIDYSYDGTLVTEAHHSGTIAQSLGFSYNSDFNLVGVAYAGDREEYSYDRDRLLTGAGRFSIARNSGNGLPESVADGNLSVERSYNGYGELEEETCSIASQPVAGWHAVRDSNGRIIEKTETIGGETNSYDYGYDCAGRLCTVHGNGNLVEEYQYDLSGVRVYEMNSLRGIAGRSYAYSDEDHLLTVGDTSYQYSVDGFLTTRTDGSGNTTTYDYSSRGELMGVTLPDGTAIDYVHDPLGRRIAKAVNGVIIEKYLWLGLTKLLAVYDGSDALLMRFEYADGRMPYAMTTSGGSYYLAYDQVGSLKTVADESGNIVKETIYDSFGTIITDSNPTLAIPFGFAGGLHDRDTSLIRFGHRDYDPDTGRWTAKDPILFAGGSTDLYGYCMNDPVNGVDPEGLFINLAAAGVGAAVGAAIGTADAIFKRESIIKGAFMGAAVGALAGISFGSSVLVNAAIGAGVGVTSDLIGQKISKPCGHIDTLSVAINALAGAIGGGAGTAMLKGGTVAVDAAFFSGAIAGGVSTTLHANANY